MQKSFISAIFFIIILTITNVSSKGIHSGYTSMKVNKEKLLKTKIFDLKSKDPFFGVKFITGYLDFPKSPEYEEKSQYYLYMFNNKGLKPEETPQIIMNPGGPCWGTLVELFIGTGPWVQDLPELVKNSKLKLSKNKYSSESLGDTMYLDLQLGAGFSKTNPIATTYKRNSEDLIISLDLFQKKFPHLLSKKRPIYFYGSSYSGLALTFAMNRMLDMGWNLKGFIDDGPVGNIKKWGPYAIDNLYKYGNISYYRYQFFKFISTFSSLLFQMNVIGSRALGSYMEILPIVGLDGKLLASVNDVRPENPYRHILIVKSAEYLMANDHFKEAFKGRDTYNQINLKCQFIVFYNTKLDSTTQWNRLLERGVKAVLVEGKYDFPFGIETIKPWLDELDFSKKGFADTNWEKTKYGKKRSWKNLWLEIVDNDGHTTAADRPEVIYYRLKQMIEGTIVSD